MSSLTSSPASGPNDNSEEYTKKLLESAYELIVGREPKDPRKLPRLLNRSADLRRARDLFLQLPEVQEVVSVHTRGPNLISPKTDVAVEVPDQILQQMFRRIEAVFQKNASEEPYFTVSTVERFKKDKLQETMGTFFKEGEKQVEYVKAFASRAGIDLGSFKSCFELGCGVGRVTVWLAELFPQVFAWDISEHMLDEARRTVSFFGLTNVTLHLCNKFAEFQNLPEFDFFFSVIVLQHNPPPVINYMLRSILGRLNPGGVGFFQVPTYRTHYTFSAESYLSMNSQDHRVEMHFLPQAELFRLIEENGCRILEIREHGKKERISNIVFVQKHKSDVQNTPAAMAHSEHTEFTENSSGTLNKRAG